MESNTLQQQYEQGSTRLLFRCFRPGVKPGNALCDHASRIDIRHAIDRWGKDRRIDQIRAICGRCGSRDFVGITGEPPGRQGKRGNR